MTRLTSKSQITLKSLIVNDEIVTYSTGNHTNCVKTRKIDGKRVYILDFLYLGVFKSKQYATLAELKRNITINFIGQPVTELN